MSTTDRTQSDDGTRDEELLADLFDSLLQGILEGRTPDLEALHPDRPDLRERINKTWSLACSVAGRREPSRPVFGGYEIVRELGHGGMGTVYLARHQTLQRDVAVKVLPQSLAMSAHAKKRFVEEARALAQLRHEHVVHLHRIVDHAEMLAFEMEYIDGPSLQQLVTELRKSDRPHSIDCLAAVLGLSEAALSTRYAVEWFVRLFIKIARALGEVHRHGLVHRDVKPANILLRKDGTPVLADFGLALQSDLDPQQRKFAGTAIYAAPERLRGDDLDAGPATDVYSLGVTLHEVLTQSPPFQGKTTQEVLRRIESGNLPSLRSQAPHVSHDLATITHKAMEPDPRHRYATADDFADDLERLLSLEPIHAQPAGPVRRAVKFVRRHQKAFAAATCGALLVALIAWPLAAMAAEDKAQQETARIERHRARTQLLCQESLPSWWTGGRRSGRKVEQSRRQSPQRRALGKALRHYDLALAATPGDAELRQEANAVRAALSTLQESKNAKSFDTSDAFSAGLHAFLIGDRSTHRQRWRDLPSEGNPFVEACIALDLATDGKAARAYPRAFYAARAYPEATALVIAMAEGAVRSGDLTMAQRWFQAIPAETDVLETPRLLLAADLLAAAGQTEPARQQYRELSKADPTDPRPLLRIVDLALREHNLEGAQRLCRSLLRRWPDLWPARAHLARLCLQRRDSAGYLAHVRFVLREYGLATRECQEIFQLGGLDTGRLRAAPGQAASLPAGNCVPLKTFLSPDALAGIERVLDVQPTFDAISNLANAFDARPVGAAIVSLGIAGLRFADLTAELPVVMQAALPLLVRLRELPVQNLSRLLLPYQTALGSRFHAIEDRRVFSYRDPTGQTFYGLQLLNVGDIDGDTLPDICISAPPGAGQHGPGFAHLRRADDGSLLAEWSDEDSDGMFARAISNLGDVDGDSCDDVLIGKPIANYSTAEDGQVELRSGRTGQRIWQISYEYGSFGAALCTIADTDADGIRDFVVGMPPLSLEEAGGAWIHSGKDGSELLELEPPEAGTWFGGTVATTKDINGNGFDDVLVGGNYGRAKGLVIVYDGKTGERLLTVTDEHRDSQFGHSLEAVGDIDGDTTPDFAIGAPGKSAGSVAIISGRTGNSLYELQGEAPGNHFGTVLRRLPDWRGDHKPVLAVTSMRGGPTGGGYVRVFDLAQGAPLQTFAMTGGRLGFGMINLGDRTGDGLLDLGVMSISPDGTTTLWVMSFADIGNGNGPWPSNNPR